jgi:hypothetical protein
LAFEGTATPPATTSRAQALAVTSINSSHIDRFHQVSARCAALSIRIVFDDAIIAPDGIRKFDGMFNVKPGIDLYTPVTGG